MIRCEPTSLFLKAIFYLKIGHPTNSVFLMTVRLTRMINGYQTTIDIHNRVGMNGEQIK